MGASRSYYFWDVWFSFAHSWFGIYQENIWFLKLWSFEIFISNFETLEIWDFELKFGIWSLKFWALEFWKLRLGILIMKSDVWNFLKTEDLNLKFRHLRKFENENLELKTLDFKRYLKTLKKIFFFWVDRVNSVMSLFFLILPSTFLPPLALFSFFFPLIFLLQLTISSHKKHFSKLLHLPSPISINIFLDFCVLSIFITHPFLVKPIFQNPFSLHQNCFFLQGIFFSSLLW